MSQPAIITVEDGLPNDADAPVQNNEKPKDKTQGEIVRDRINEIFTSENPDITNPDFIKQLKKRILSEYKLKGGWGTKVKNHIESVMEERGISKGKIPDNVNVNLKSADIQNSTSDDKNSHAPSGASATGAVPAQSQDAPPSRVYKTPEEKRAAMEKIITSVTGIMNSFYIKIGLIQGDEIEEEVKPKTKKEAIEEFNAESKRLSAELADVCEEYDWQLPKEFRLALVLAGFGNLYGAPIVSKYLSGNGAADKAKIAFKNLPSADDKKLQDLLKDKF